MTFEIAPEELPKLDLLRELDSRTAVTCRVSRKQAKALKRLWSNYDGYARSVHGPASNVAVKLRGESGLCGSSALSFSIQISISSPTYMFSELGS